MDLVTFDTYGINIPKTGAAAADLDSVRRLADRLHVAPVPTGKGRAMVFYDGDRDCYWDPFEILNALLDKLSGDA